jgi:hypothetical protein
MLSLPMATSPLEITMAVGTVPDSPPGVSADAQGRLAPRLGALFMCSPTGFRFLLRGATYRAMIQSIPLKGLVRGPKSRVPHAMHVGNLLIRTQR